MKNIKIKCAGIFALFRAKFLHLEHGQLCVESVLAGVERDRLEVDLLVPELHPHGGGHAQQDVLALLQVLPHGRALSRPLGK